MHRSPRSTINKISMPMAEFSMPPTQELFDAVRLTSILLPIFQLTLVFSQQSAYSVWYAFTAVLHVFSNPVDSLLSILCRQRAIRRCYLVAASQTPDVARELSMVLATYDQWLEDACPQFTRVLAARRQMRSSDGSRGSLLLEEEKLLIRRCALRLRSCRVDSSLGAKLSIVAYLWSLILATGRALYWDEGSDLSVLTHMVPVMAILNYLVLAIYIDGNTGMFAYQEEVARLIFELCTELRAISLKPPYASVLLQPPSPCKEITDSTTICTNATEFFRLCESLGTASGMVNCLRPLKSFSTEERNDESTTMLSIISLSAVIVSCSSAMCVQMVAASKDLMTLAPFAACLLSWIVNWIVTMAASNRLKNKRIGMIAYARLIQGCDLVFALLIFYCFISFASVLQQGDVSGFTTMTQLRVLLIVILAELVAMYLLSVWAGTICTNFRHVFVRTVDEALADVEATM